MHFPALIIAGGVRAYYNTRVIRDQVVASLEDRHLRLFLLHTARSRAEDILCRIHSLDLKTQLVASA